MKMNRRGFVKLGALGALGLAVGSNLPNVSKIRYINPKKPVAAALTKAYNDHMRGRGSKHSPKYIIVGKDLYERFESELMHIQRWVAFEQENPGIVFLYFKGVKMVWSGPGWHYRFANDLDLEGSIWS